MDDKLKRNIRTTLIFMLVAALLPCLSFIPPLATLPAASMPGVLILFLVLISVIAAIISGSRVIWKLPLKPLIKQLIFVLWLILYLALCGAWYDAIFFLSIMIYRSH